MLGYDAARTNYNFAETMKPSLKQLKVLDLGSEASGKNMAATIFAADESNIYTLYYPKSVEQEDEKSKISASDIKTGKKRWEFSKSMLGVGAMDKKHLYCVSTNPNKVFALELKSGKKVWESQLVKEAIRQQIYIPVVRQNIVYIVSEDAKLFALDANTGKKKWTYSEIPVVGSPAVSRGLVYCLTQDTRVLALDAKSGEQKWVVGAPDWKVLLNPSVGNGQVYIVDRNRREATDCLITLDAKSGGLQWQFPIKKNVIINNVCIGEERVFIALGVFEKAKPESKSQGEVIAVNTKNGKKVWSKDVWGMPAFLIGASDTLYISSSRTWRGTAGHLQVEGGNVFALSMKSGKTIEEYKIVKGKPDNQIINLQPPLLISNGKLFAQNVVDNTVHVFGK